MAALPAAHACHIDIPLAIATAIAVTAMKHAGYCDVHPRMALPLSFVVEHAGGINKGRRGCSSSGCAGMHMGFGGQQAQCKSERPALLVQQGPSNFSCSTSRYHDHELVLRALDISLWPPRPVSVLLSSNSALVLWKRH